MEIIPAKLLRIYLKEEDKYEKEPLLELIVKILKKNNVSGVTVLRGLYGHGMRGTSRIDIIRLSMNLPIVIECVEYEDKLMKILPKITDIIGENGLIHILDVEVVKK
ncbi:DUF190 domain-containing protein [Methanothermococcus thermolithotrophicus]|jgi:hypothetical protein|uniref:DUF190 domain-containing protein n=1 Tax=Methanothermococcus thermolithotrophicus TaxID=2186 RepID=UPI000372C0DD|nr:DUF190 domain-containing protein [Methanothermococcus thermolithotrophicus]